MKITKLKLPTYYLGTLLAQLRRGVFGRCSNSSCVREGGAPKKYKEFLCDYRFKGEKYCISIMATPWEEAEQRLRSIAGNGKITGGPVVFSVKIPFT